MIRMASILITGANRGIGLGLVKQFLEQEGVGLVFATTRNTNAEDLKAIHDPRLKVIQLSVEDDESIKRAAEEVAEIVGDNGLDILINNAGVFHKTDLRELDREAMLAHFNTNAVGPALVTSAFHNLLKQAANKKGHAQVAVISSTLGSLAVNQTGAGIAAYAMSKAAVNRYVAYISKEWAEDKIWATAFCPGWVQTRMGTAAAHLTVEQSTSELSRTILKLGEIHNGAYLNHKGEKIAW